MLRHSAAATHELLWVVRIAGRPLVGLAGDPALFASLARNLDRSTRKRAVFRAVVLLLTRMRIYRIVGVPIHPRSLPGLSETVERAGMHFDHRASAWSVVWATGKDRSERLYLLVVGQSGAPLVFARITTDLKRDLHLFRREEELLRHFENHPLSRWRVPKSRGLLHSPDFAALLLEPLPTNQQSLAWEQILEGLPVADLRTARVNDIAWISEGLSLPMTMAFRMKVQNCLREPIGVGVTNGDIRPNNAIVAGGERWMFDWEMGSLEGPANVDIVALGLNSITSASRPPAPPVVYDLLTEWIHREELTESSLILGLLYLATVNHPWAKALMLLEWPNPAPIEGLPRE